MAVVINEFEVVPTETPSTGTTSQTASDEQSTAELSEDDIERLVAKRGNRSARVWAH